jgi:hypothetical protein
MAVMNISKNADFDYMLVTTPGRLWTARAFALAFNRYVHLFGHTLCPNLIVSENALEWPLHDLYSARELYQMIPITGIDVYQRLLKANEWAKDFLPNAFLECDGRPSPMREQAVALQRVLEFSLRGKPGDLFEKWEMTRKVARFSKQAGFGAETIFNADVCQGNFHHHRKWTHDVYIQRLQKLNLDSDSRLSVLSGASSLIP